MSFLYSYCVSGVVNVIGRCGCIKQNLPMKYVSNFYLPPPATLTWEGEEEDPWVLHRWIWEQPRRGGWVKVMFVSTRIVLTKILMSKSLHPILTTVEKTHCPTNIIKLKWFEIFFFIYRWVFYFHFYSRIWIGRNYLSCDAVVWRMRRPNSKMEYCWVIPELLKAIYPRALPWPLFNVKKTTQFLSPRPWRLFGRKVGSNLELSTIRISHWKIFI